MRNIQITSWCKLNVDCTTLKNMLFISGKIGKECGLNIILPKSTKYFV